MISEFTVVPPRVFLWFLGVILLIVIVSMFLKKGSSVQKIAALVIVLVVLGVVAFVFYRPTVVSIDEHGVSVKRFREQSILWSEVQTAEWIADLADSQFRPKARILGASLGLYKVGTFRLRDGSKARVVMEQDREALLIATVEQQHLFALEENEALIDAVAAHIEVK
jgi:hypothetical protein